MTEAVEPAGARDLSSSDFDSTERAQLREALRATPDRRLAMLEELIEFARRAGASPRPARRSDRF